MQRHLPCCGGDVGRNGVKHGLAVSKAGQPADETANAGSSETPFSLSRFLASPPASARVLLWKKVSRSGGQCDSRDGQEQS